MPSSSSPPPPPPVPDARPPCRLCGSPLPAEGARCPACGLYQASDVAPESRWQLVGGMVVVYAVVALLVLATR